MHSRVFEYMHICWRGGAVVERRACDLLGWAHDVKTLGKFLISVCLCHQAVQFGTGVLAGKLMAGYGRGVVYRP